MSPRPEPSLVPTDPPTSDAAGNPRFKRLKLDPNLHDGQNWTIHDVPNQVLLDNIRAWMEEALAGDGIAEAPVPRGRAVAVFSKLRRQRTGGLDSKSGSTEAEALPDV